MKNELDLYLEAIKTDYIRSYRRTDDEDEIRQKVRNEMVYKFINGLSYEVGSKYIRVITSNGTSRSVHSFIVREDGPKFKKGDILKAAGWAAPAKNQARGNIFGEYHTNWTGADYLR